MDPSLAARALTLVVDASILLGAAVGGAGAGPFPREEIVAPPLAWSEAISALHESVWRRERTAAVGREALQRLSSLDIVSRSPRELRTESWRIADRLGWAKTYDAEYLALAAILKSDLATLDAGLRDGAERIGIHIRLMT